VCVQRRAEKWEKWERRQRVRVRGCSEAGRRYLMLPKTDLEFSVNLARLREVRAGVVAEVLSETEGVVPAAGGGAEVEPETDGVVHAAALAPVANLVSAVGSRQAVPFIAAEARGSWGAPPLPFHTAPTSMP
jgi:hypothetical protein